MEIGDERRKAERFPMRVPISFGTGSGTTRDISGTGVYFETDYPFEIGSEIDFSLVVPDSMTVNCRGTIIRVDPMREHFGIAASIDNYSIAGEEKSTASRPHIIIDHLRKHLPDAP
jgi:hypothetical protein